MRVWMLVVFALALAPLSGAHAHTIDAIDNKYRIEIGWMNEPVVSEETNGIELFISPLTPCPGIEPITCAGAQSFHDGIAGLEKDLKIQMVYRTDRITLPLRADHNIDGKYYAFVDPTVAGFYQVNVLGKVSDTVVSLSMHPPKVDEREHIEFPERENQDILEAQVAIMAEIAALRNQTLEISEEFDVVQDAVRSGQGVSLTYVAIALGGIGIAVAAIAITRR